MGCSCCRTRLDALLLQHGHGHRLDDALDGGGLACAVLKPLHAFVRIGVQEHSVHGDAGKVR